MTEKLYIIFFLFCFQGSQHDFIISKITFNALLQKKETTYYLINFSQVPTSLRRNHICSHLRCMEEIHIPVFQPYILHSSLISLYVNSSCYQIFVTHLKKWHPSHFTHVNIEEKSILSMSLNLS